MMGGMVLDERERLYVALEDVSARRLGLGGGLIIGSDPNWASVGWAQHLEAPSFMGQVFVKQLDHNEAPV